MCTLCMVLYLYKRIIIHMNVETMFSTIECFAGRLIQGLLNHKLKQNGFFSLVKIFTNARRCQLQSNNLNKM
jgi:hypothetical protein